MVFTANMKALAFRTCSSVNENFLLGQSYKIIHSIIALTKSLRNSFRPASINLF